VPAVSVVTPAFNASAFVADTIESVMAQTVPDWELLVVDDGSTDDTVPLVRGYMARDSRIRLLQQSNRGPAAARNHGMREARGEFVAFLDSDDAWDPEYLACQLEVFRRHPETSLVTGVARFRGGPRDGEAMRRFETDYRVIGLRDILADDTAVFIMTIFRRTVFEAIGGMDEAQWRSEDYDFWLRAALAGFIFRRNARPLGRYRIRSGSLSTSTVDMLRGILETYAKVRPACAAGTVERTILERQVARFERELLLAQAKLAIEQRAFSAAAKHLRDLRARGAGPLIGVTAWLAEHAPPAAAFAYRMRRLARGGREAA
jgi:cellulose synthase/poly-beta-1,6-N-acetylglucosamine synthase-like glycosyltransferase